MEVLALSQVLIANREQQERGLPPDPMQLVWGSAALAPHQATLGVTRALGQLIVGNLNFQQNSGKQLQLLSEHF